MHIQISLGTKFCLELALLNFWIKLTQKMKNYHRLMHIQINLDFELHLQQTILIFRTNFQKNIYCQSKTEKNEHRY